MSLPYSHFIMLGVVGTLVAAGLVAMTIGGVKWILKRRTYGR